MAVSKSFAQFEKRMNKRADEVLKATEKAIQRVVSVGVPIVAQTTPIDTSNAVRNWDIIFGNAPTLADPSKDRPTGEEQLEVLRATAAAAPIETTRKMWSQLRGINLVASEDVNMVNQTPYIMKLEMGHSRQAPSGISKRAILVMSAITKKEKLTLSK